MFEGLRLLTLNLAKRSFLGFSSKSLDGARREVKFPLRTTNCGTTIDTVCSVSDSARNMALGGCVHSVDSEPDVVIEED